MEKYTEVFSDYAYDGGYDVFAEYGKGKTSGTAESKPSHADQQEGTGGRSAIEDNSTPSNDGAVEGSHSDPNRTAGEEGQDGKTEDFVSRPASEEQGRSESQEEGGNRNSSSNQGSAGGESGSDYDSGYGECWGAWQADIGYGVYGARGARYRQRDESNEEELGSKGSLKSITRALKRGLRLKNSS